jgi:hypothetical protein
VDARETIPVDQLRLKSAFSGPRRDLNWSPRPEGAGANSLAQADFLEVIRSAGGFTVAPWPVVDTFEA